MTKAKALEYCCSARTVLFRETYQMSYMAFVESNVKLTIKSLDLRIKRRGVFIDLFSIYYKSGVLCSTMHFMGNCQVSQCYLENQNFSFLCVIRPAKRRAGSVTTSMIKKRRTSDEDTTSAGNCFLPGCGSRAQA